VRPSPKGELREADRSQQTCGRIRAAAGNLQSQLGMRMYHCHILEHEDQGMMDVLDVVT